MIYPGPEPFCKDAGPKKEPPGGRERNSRPSRSEEQRAIAHEERVHARSLGLHLGRGRPPRRRDAKLARRGEPVTRAHEVMALDRIAQEIVELPLVLGGARRV